MSLDFDLKQIEDHENLCFIEDENQNTVLHPITNMLIWSTFMVGLGSITEDNVEEWVHRAHICRIIGYHWGIRHDADGAPEGFTPATIEIRGHTGLRTNCDSLTRKQWWAKMGKIFDERAERAMTKETDDTYFTGDEDDSGC